MSGEERSIRALMIDDDEEDFLLVRDLLSADLPRDEKEPVHLDHALSVEAALELLQQGEYDAILLDYYLGENDGLYLLRKIRAQGCQAPVLLLTGQGDEELAMAALRQGATDYLRKSKLTSDLINTALRRAIDWRAEQILRHSAEEQLKRNEQCFRALVENSSDGLQMLSAKSRIIYASRSSERVLGYRVNEYIGRSSANFVHPDEAAHMKRLFRECLASPGKTIAASCRALHADGSWRHIEGTLANYIHDPAIGAIVLNFRDVTARRQAEDAHRVSEERFRQIVESNMVGIAFWNKDGYVLEGNEEFLRILGYRSHEVGGRKLRWEDITPPEYYEADQKAAEQMRSGGRCAPYRKEFLRKDGTLVPVTVVGALLHDPDRDGVCFVIDASHQEQLASQLRQAQKMEALGLLAGGVAHDFNNMLGVISGYAELLREQLPGQPTVSRYVSMMLSVIKRGSMLTGQLLAFSRKQAVSPRTIRLSEQLKDIWIMLRRLIKEDIVLAQLMADEPWPVRIDPAQADQLIMNLVVNARDAMPNGGTLTIEMRNVLLEETSPKRPAHIVPSQYVMFSVSDTGMGMSAETKSHIFEPFYTTKSAGKGTGLGLATVYGIVDQNGGFVDVQSEPGKGTTFEIYFPRSVQDLEPASIEATETDKGGDETLLVVEDYEPLCDAVSEYLRSKGYTVLQAVNGAEGLKIFERYGEKLSLLITDMVMPGMNGRDLVQNIMTRAPGIKVLFMSGYDDQVAADHPELAGAAVIQKPFAMRRLASQVRQLLGCSNSSASVSSVSTRVS